MKQRKKNKMINVFLAIAVITFLVVAIPIVIAYFDKSPDSIKDVISSCKNKDLEDSSKCVLNITKDFYKYNLENEGKKLDFQTLKDEGGVCSSWSEYYSDIGSGLGFNTKNVIIKTQDDLYHEFSVWSSEKGYCVLDQTELMCVPLQ